MKLRRFIGLLALLAAVVVPLTGCRAPRFAARPTYDPDTLFLTWHGDPTTSMTIQWLDEQSRGSSFAVWFAAESSSRWQKVDSTADPFPLTKLLRHRANMRGLKPDTLYRFRVGLNSPEYRFRTAPARLDRPLTFVHGGDSGSGVGAVLVNKFAAKQNPLFAFLGGDIAYSNGRTPSLEIAFLQNWKRHMVAPDGRLIPLIVAIGNHEVDGGYNKTLEEAPFFNSLFGPRFGRHGYATYDFGDYLSIIALDSGHVTPIEGAQTRWLEAQLEKRRRVPHVFAAYHVPAYPSHRPYDGEGPGKIREHWVPVMERFPLAAVLEHHDHTYKRTHPLRGGKVDPAGLVFIGDGAWGAGPRTVKSPDELWYLKTSAPRLHCIVTTLEGGKRTHTAVEPNGNVLDTCSSAAPAE